jgi:hypothetical protein
VFTNEGDTEPDRQNVTWGRGRLDHFGLQAPSAESFETIRVIFRDPDGLEGEVLFAK